MSDDPGFDAAFFEPGDKVRLECEAGSEPGRTWVVVGVVKEWKQDAAYLLYRLRTSDLFGERIERLADLSEIVVDLTPANDDLDVLIGGD
jgi:hypothetical protein